MLSRLLACISNAWVPHVAQVLLNHVLLIIRTISLAWDWQPWTVLVTGMKNNSVYFAFQFIDIHNYTMLIGMANEFNCV